MIYSVCKNLDRTVVNPGMTVDFLQTAWPDNAAAMRLSDKTRQANIVPEMAAANQAVIDEINARGETPRIVRQIKYLNNVVEQHHRTMK